MSIASFLAAVDQTAEAFDSLPSGEVAVYFNISGQMLQAFALLEAYPGDIEKVMMSTSMISNSLNNVLALSNITALPNGQSVQEVTHPLILSSAMATHILFNLSMSNSSLSSGAEKEMLLTQTFNQMVISSSQGNAHVLLCYQIGSIHCPLESIQHCGNHVPLPRNLPAGYTVSSYLSKHYLRSDIHTYDSRWPCLHLDDRV